MATIVKTPAGSWKAVIRKTGWPTTAKTFRTKRDAQDWSRRTEDEMVRGVYIQRSASERMTLEAAIRRYLADVTPTKKTSTQKSEHHKARTLIEHLGKFSLAALTPELVANYRDTRLNSLGSRGQPISPNTVRLELALLGHLFTVAIQEWGLGLTYNPVQNIRKPSPGEGRDRRLSPDEEKRLFAVLRQHSNPMLAWIARIALETGMRSSEILTLTRSQVDVKRRVVRLTDTKNNEARLVPLTQAATEVFKQALNNPVRPLDCDLVFFGEPGRDGKRGPYSYSKLWNLAKKKAGLDPASFTRALIGRSESAGWRHRSSRLASSARMVVE